MPEVLAVVVAGVRRQQVLDVADAVAELVRARVQVLELPEAPADVTASAVRSAVDDPGVLVAVLAADVDVDGASWQVMRDVATPLVLLPVGLAVAQDGAQPPIGRVLVPLDGTPECAHAVEHTVGLCTRAGVDLVVLHVFGPGTTPPFWDQSAHALRAWSEEFLTRHVPAPGVRLEVRAGTPDETVLDVARSLGADLIALGWSQRLEGGHARTVRRSVAEAEVPVMLVPVNGSDRFGPSEGRSSLSSSPTGEVS